MAKAADRESVLKAWCDRDLTASAQAAELTPAYAIDDRVEELSELLSAGTSFLIVGDPGVGKTALIHELLRRRTALEDDPPRFLQLSFRRRASALENPAAQMGRETAKLIEALLATGPSVVPVIPDFEYVYVYGLEPQLLSFLYQFPGVMIAEGRREVVDAMFEATGEMEQHLVILPIAEPTIDQMKPILARWNESHDGAFTPDALEQALTVTHRFLARTHLPRKAFDFLTPLLNLSRERPITEAAVIERFSLSHRVPRQLIDPAMPLDLGALEAEFDDKVLGQREAIKTIVRTIGMIKAGLSDVRRPFGVFLFVGPTGVGKTHVAQLLAEYLFGSRDRVLRFNMADYQHEYGALTLFGNPEGYGASQRGVLTIRLMGHPFGVLLLDEFEKAHPTVHDRFLQLVDEGGFINGQGETVQCRSLIIIATSNAGAELYRSQRFGFSEARRPFDLAKDLNRELEKHFRFEFLNRFDSVVHFEPLRRKHIRTIAERELALLRERSGLRQRRLELDIDESVLDWLSVRGYDPDYGARFLKRLIEREVTSALAESIVRQSVEPGARIELRVRGDEIATSVVGKARASTDTSVATGRRSKAARRELDPAALEKEVERWIAIGAPMLEALEAKRHERTLLLERMNEHEFWDRREENEDVLERFRQLDVDVRTESRLARPVERLMEGYDESPRDRERIARDLGLAEAAIRDWERRVAEQGPRSVWLVFEAADLLRPVDGWITELVELEMKWCRNLHLQARVVAYSLSSDRLTRVAMEAEGIGAHALLSMEEGIHRWSVSDGGDRKVRVRVLERELTKGAARPVRTIRSRQGLFGLTLTCRGRIEDEDRGLVSDWLGGDEETLSELLTDVAGTWRDKAEVTEVARVYGKDGVGAKDPRTGAQQLRVKDVLRGELGPFLEAWRGYNRP